MPQPDPEPTEPTTRPASDPTDTPTHAPTDVPNPRVDDERVAPPDDLAPAEPVPSESELERTATPGRVRRAPKFGAFLVAGGLIGAVLGLVVSLLAPVGLTEKPDGSGFLPFLDGVNGARTWLVAAGAVLGIFVGGLVAVLADRRSVRDR